MGVLKMDPSVTRKKKNNDDNAVNCKALPHIIRARSTLRTTTFYKAPTLSKNTLLSTCETYKCTIAVFRGEEKKKKKKP